MLDSREISCRQFCRIAALSALLLVASVTLFNAVVDPFGMYRIVNIVGFNRHKPDIYHRVRLLKAFEVRRIKPRAIVFGTSRSHIALSPAHKGWKASPVYNLAFDGATPMEMYFYLLHADAVRPLKQVVVGLDTYQLYQVQYPSHPQAPVPAAARPDFDPELLYNPLAPVEMPRFLTADLRLLASLDTLRASIDTLRKQGDDEPEWFAANGQRLGNVFFRNFGASFITKGPRAYFEEIDKQEVEEKKRSTANSAVPPLTYVERMIAFCRLRHIDLRFYITPAHAHQMEIAARMDGWRSVEDGKRDLVNLLARDAAAHPGLPPIPLFDFSGYSVVTTEPLPPRGSRAEMRYYWDSSHFKQAIGDRILDRVLSWPNSRAGADDFGVRLTPQTIEAALARTRTRQMAYERTHPADIAAIDTLIRAGEKATAVASQ
jgi:hypothetical protein